MDCDLVQERLSAFLDREESTENIETTLSHLYNCGGCQDFFNAAVRLRSLASDDREAYPLELDDVVMRQVQEKRKKGFLRYSLRLPAYAVSAAAIILIAISFAFGFLMQRDLSQREMQRLLSSQGFYVMPQQTVYPVMSRQIQGDNQ